MSRLLNKLADCLYDHSVGRRNHLASARRIAELENQMAATVAVLDRIGPRPAEPRRLASVSPIRTAVEQ